MNIEQSTINHNPQILKVYLYYRLLLGLILYSMYEAELAPKVLGTEYPDLFWLTSFFYILICFGALFVFRAEQLRHSFNRITGLLVIDLFALLLLIYASGGPESGLGYLLLVNTAMASIFLRGRLSLAYASIITIFVIAQAVYQSQTSGNYSQNMFAAGSLGILIFLSSIAFTYLTERIRQSDSKAIEQAQYAKHLEKLAKLIVARMRTGVIVIDEENKIELINDSALQLLDISPNGHYINTSIEEISNLKDLILTWRAYPIVGIPKVHQLRAGQEVRISFSRLGNGLEERTLLYLEDYRTIAQHAQQLKLASLGTLTASIAHEVRNPLGAISHAAQLLQESDELPKEDHRLIEIILQHSDRVNQIINNTLVLSRRKEPNAERVDLEKWLHNFQEEYSIRRHATILLTQISENAQTKFDPTHLNQVITNLVDNGVRYSQENIGESKIEIRYGVSDNEETAFLEVIDYGKGVDEKNLQTIFEPFFTTEQHGTGLGLYICKELCEINQATLHYKKNELGQSCFRINFSHHQRVI